MPPVKKAREARLRQMVSVAVCSVGRSVASAQVVAAVMCGSRVMALIVWHGGPLSTVGGSLGK